MIKNLFRVVVFSIFILGCKDAQNINLTEAETEANKVTASVDTYAKDNYTKKEVMIEMRDGIKLHTTIYSPKDTSKTYPMLMMRTPYSCRPYGENEFKSKIGPNKYLMEEGNIMVYQDVRGRWNSEGVYDNMRAYIPNKTGNQVDEASDTYDTIEWLVNNVDNNNGNVGTYGISYPGFYATYSLLDSHPALKAVSPQACIGDFFFDDFIHNGAFLLSYWRATSVFGYMKDTPTKEAWYEFPDIGTEDQYQFFLDNMPLSKLDDYYDEKNVFMTQIEENVTYNEFWQKRGIIQHLKDIKPATMIVGGQFDAEDLYGPYNTYKSIEANSDNYNTVVFGPWSHGDWARNRERQVIGNVHFGDSLSDYFQKNIETKFFNHFLKGEANGETGLAEAHMFDTGKKEWQSFEQWPPKNTTKESWFMQPEERLTQRANRMIATSDFISDPKKPVPYSEDIKVVFTPRKFMTDDQRFASRRPDVLTFETEVLENDVTLAGDILSKLNVSTTGTAADWIVKLVDVYPADTENTDDVQDHLKLSNYHMLVRSEVLRGRFRNSMTNPEPFVPNQKTAVNLKLQDVFHTFKKGHKIQVQVQSTFFPYIDANPQTYVDNIFKAKEEDFKAQTHKVYNDSSIEFTILK
ncbi:X-Pro dipeptidyl-peptidase [Winogradskyella sp. PC-19]|uniref:CocE/NonD family hydrolase n=1 Tax=unclassified Winogradskyella TaxID=2615021 RepID=UPI000B3D2944|nr:MULTISPECIES: CocE/NonD family hydrolase [unclassified Winogradskyella]ARV08807.1 X-Pro dipeptidyl-peptidase [Winogradskyella sp. PC-19]RZN76852.1 MAG: CocE/NonD family hydrolase [Winogradskyella sp.]